VTLSTTTLRVFIINENNLKVDFNVSRCFLFLTATHYCSDLYTHFGVMLVVGPGGLAGLSMQALWTW